MKTQMKQFTKIAAATALLAASLISTGAMAETVTSTIDAKAGLAPAIELSCTPVSFGVWRVPVRSTSGTTTITLNAAADTVVASGNTTRVAQSAVGAWIHSKGVCTLSGSLAADTTAANVSISENTAMAFSAADATATGYTSLNAATTAAALVATLTVPVTSVITSGATTFNVGGVLTIPQNIVVGNYGGYKTTTPATVSVQDDV